MKIKAVCEQTGLTDRTIRYYIEEGLISPFYTENYLGRKNFDFSEADVAMLNCQTPWQPPSTRQLSQMEIQKPAPSRPLYLSPGPFSRELSDFSH